MFITLLYIIYYLLHHNGIKTNKTNINACKTNPASQPSGLRKCLMTDTTNKKNTNWNSHTISDVRHVPERTFLQVVIVINVAPGQCSVVSGLFFKDQLNFCVVVYYILT